MAVAPVNKFLTIAVPVAPGEQIVYSTPTGVSSIILYAQVSNVGVNTYPSVTFTHRRKTNKTGNTRDIRIIKESEVPPNDSLIISDSVVIRGTQSGIVTVTGCLYDTYTGITTITTLTAHNFVANDQVTMSGLKFTCTGSTGITTTIFPSPQASFSITSISGSVGTSKTFVTNSGVGAGITHTYVSGGLVAPLQMEFICSILENSLV